MSGKSARPTVSAAARVRDRSWPSRAISTCWQIQKNSPAFVMNDARATFDLAVVGETHANVLDSLRTSGKPIIHICNGRAQKFPGVLDIPQIAGWLELVIAVANRLLEHSRAASELAVLSEEARCTIEQALAALPDE